MVFPQSPVLPDSNAIASDVVGTAGDGRQLIPIGVGSSRTHGLHDDSGSRRPWLPKMEFPRFDGTDARI